MKTLNLVALTLLIIGGLNWLLVGAFQFDIVAYLFGGSSTGMARLVYVLVGFAALYCIGLFRLLSDDTNYVQSRTHTTPVTSARM